MASWRTGTKKQYKTYVERWLVFCRERKSNHSSPKIGEALQFLMSLYNQGLTYSTICTARSALPLILNIEGPHPFGSHPLVSRFLKGIYETRKPQPKYKTIWDVAIVLKHLKTLEPLEELSLKHLTLKLLLLLLLATGQRGQTIYLLSLDGMTMSPLSSTFDLLEHIKSSKPNKRTNSIDIHGYQADDALCPLLTLREYLKRTAPLRGTERKLFVSFIQPHKGVSRDTISRWANSDWNQQELIQVNSLLIAPGQLLHPKQRERSPSGRYSNYCWMGVSSYFSKVLPQTYHPATYLSGHSSSDVIQTKQTTLFFVVQCFRYH